MPKWSCSGRSNLAKSLMSTPAASGLAIASRSDLKAIFLGCLTCCTMPPCVCVPRPPQPSIVNV